MMELVQKNGNGLIHVDPAAVAAAEAAKARIQAAYIMALQKPRNPDQARIQILEACRRPAFAERVEYSKPVGGRAIKGPSIRFAETALREWQNIMSESQMLYEDDFVRRIKIIVTDLETNASFSKEVQINKTVERSNNKDREVLGERTNTQGKTVYIVKATDDELQNKEAALISKTLRNEGLRLIPSDIVDEALDTARETLQNRDSIDPNAAKKVILDAFAEIGIKPVDIERYLGHKTDALVPSELQDLRGIYRAIRDGEARWSDYVGTKEGDEPPVDLTPDFEAAVKKSGIKHGKMVAVHEFVKACAETRKLTAQDIMRQAIDSMQSFMDGYVKWNTKRQSATPEPEPPKAGDPDPLDQALDGASKTDPAETEKSALVKKLADLGIPMSQILRAYKVDSLSMVDVAALQDLYDENKAKQQE